MSSNTGNEILEEVRENDAYRPDDVDDEDVSQGSAEIEPWDPAKIRITTKNFSLRDVVQQILEDEIDLAPDFQREYVWKERQQTRLVESILLGIPLPAFYFNQDVDGTFQVVDGVQRLTTIAKFMRDEHVLAENDLEYLKELKGRVYSKLEPSQLRRFRSAQIVVHVIEPQTPDEVKYDIFARVNTLGSPLSAQEIRHAISKSPSRDLLRYLTDLEVFDLATDGYFWSRTSSGEFVRDSGRMTNRELALRFCAFSHYSEDDYRKYSSLDAFLVAYTRRLDGTSKEGYLIGTEEFAALKESFSRAMENAHNILQRLAFRRVSQQQKRRGPINRAIFESQAIALAPYSWSQLESKSDRIRIALSDLFSNDDYVRAVTVGTGDPKKVTLRLDMTRNAVIQAIS